MSTPTVNIRVEIERLSQTVIASLPDFNGEIKAKIREATKKAVESFDFDFIVKSVVDNILKLSIEKSIDEAFKHINWYDELNVREFIQKRVD